MSSLLVEPPASFVILIVDDEAVQRRLLSRFVSRFCNDHLKLTIPFNILFSENAEDAFRLWQEKRQPIHLILSDNDMGGRSGKDFLTDIADESLFHTTLVLRTSRPKEDFPDLKKSIIHLSKSSDTHETELQEAITKAYQKALSSETRLDIYLLNRENSALSTSLDSSQPKGMAYSPLRMKDDPFPVKEVQTRDCSCLFFNRLFSGCFSKKRPSAPSL